MLHCNKGAVSVADQNSSAAKSKGARKPRAANVLTDTAIFAGEPARAFEAPAPAAAAIEAPICATETAAEALTVEAVAEAPVAIETLNTVTEANTQPGAKTMTDTIENSMNTTQAAAQQTAEQFRGAMNQTAERGKAAMERTQRFAEEFADISRGNMEAVMTSSKTAAKWIETMAQSAADYSRRSFEGASAAMRSFTEVKSPADLFRLQSEFARTAFDSAVAETARVSETVVKMGGEVAEPITSRYAVAAERMKSMAA